jgi:hypothetical protein
VSIFNFWRKRPIAAMPPNDRINAVIDINRLYGFSCKWCGVPAYDDRTDCLVCKAQYSPRVSEIVKWHKEAKWKLIKKMDYADAALVLKEVVERLAKDPELSPQKALVETLAFFKA